MEELSANSTELIKKAKEVLGPILTPEEKIVAVAVQNSISSPLMKDHLVLTTRRFIIYHPKLFGRMTLEDFLWQDINEIHVRTNLLGSTISVSGQRKMRNGDIYTINTRISGLEKQHALYAYGKAQELEEQWREINRVRDMEEKRAQSGGVYLHSSASGLTDKNRVLSVEDRLQKLQELHERNLITDAEYESRKGQIIAEL